MSSTMHPHSMEICAGTLGDFAADGDRRIVSGGGREVVVYRLDGGFVAYDNRCPHMGGPIGLGLVQPRVEAVLDEDRVPVERFSETETRLVCPWHGWEFDARTGRCAADRRFGLIRRDVEVRGDEVYVRV